MACLFFMHLVLLLVKLCPFFVIIIKDTYGQLIICLSLCTLMAFIQLSRNQACFFNLTIY